MTALLWLRRDLRIHDHPALRAALAADDHVVPVFCFDRRLLHGRHRSAIRTQFLLEALADVEQTLSSRGGGLVFRAGLPEESIPALAEQIGARRVFWTADVGPFATRRDRAVRRGLARIGADARPQPGLFAVDHPAALRTSGGGPYRVFSPFHRRWLGHERRDLAPAPRSLPPLPSNLETGELATLHELGLEQPAIGARSGGERAAREAMRRFLSEHMSGYGNQVDLADDRSSRLSPYLHLGCLSPRELEQQLGIGAGARAFRRQLAWRDFYAHVIDNFPENSRIEFQRPYRGSLRWSRSRKRFDAWREGRTGYPLVDAAMRQLSEEGWINNRARLLVGSFLTKDLGIDWRWGERWFMRKLIDGDQASNNGNWQWIASVGVDPQPAYRRIYNPTLQQQRLDPTGSYVRRYVPELQNVPDEHLPEPWTMPGELQRQTRCKIGEDYPQPIVDHAAARREALTRYAEARASDGA